MSSAAGAGPSGTQDERRSGLGKYVKRMSSVFRRDKASKKGSPASSTPAAPATPTAQDDAKEEETTATPAAPETTTPAAPATASAPAAASATVAAAAPPPASAAGAQQLNRAALQHERLKAMYVKYGLTLESYDWSTPPANPAPVHRERVEKPIRQRVRRSCHVCGTSYGADRVCAKCEHKRCKKCPRFPKKPTPGEPAKEPQAPERPKKKKLLTVTSKEGKDLVYQPVKQRVRRTCHKCQALFIPPTSTVCQACRHVRCTKCPREPAKLYKFPNGYPGDAEPDSETEVERDVDLAKRVWRKPRTRVRWECEECHSLFLDASALCHGCGHERCDKCVRKPAKRAKTTRQYDPDIVRAVEAKLKALAVQEDPPTSSAEVI